MILNGSCTSQVMRDCTTIKTINSSSKCICIHTIFRFSITCSKHMQTQEISIACKWFTEKFQVFGACSRYHSNTFQISWIMDFWSQKPITICHVHIPAFFNGCQLNIWSSWRTCRTWPRVREMRHKDVLGLDGILP